MSRNEIKDRINQGLTDNRLLEELYSELNQEERRKFKAIISQIRQEQPQLTTMQYWFYRLKLEEHHTTVKNISTTRPSRVSWQSSNLALSLSVGIITGIILWTIIKLEYKNELLSLSVGCFTIVAALNLVLLLSYRYVQHLKFFAWLIFSYVLSLLLANLITRGDSYNTLMLAGLPALSAFYLGLSTIAISSRQPKLLTATQEQFIYYINQVGKVFMVSLVLNLVVGIIIGLVVALLSLIFKNLNDDLPVFLITVSFTTVPFVVLAVVHDFNRELLDQQQLQLAVKLLQGLFFATAIIILLFLAFYLPALVPTGFEQILETGDTSSIFLGVTTIALAGIMLGSQLMEGQTNNRQINWRVLQLVHLGLVCEIIVMLVVASYALYVRIDAYGFTFSRIIGILAIISAASATILTCRIVILALLRKLQGKVYLLQLRQVFTASICLVLAILIYVPIVFDFEYFALNRQYQQQTASHEFDLSRQLDHDFFKQNGTKGIDFLAKKYPQANHKTKIDIIMILHSMADYWNEIEQESIAKLTEIENSETDPNLQSLAAYRHKYNEGLGSKDFQRQSVHDLCRQLVPEILGRTYSEDKISDFCFGSAKADAPEPVLTR